MPITRNLINLSNESRLVTREQCSPLDSLLSCYMLTRPPNSTVTRRVDTAPRNAFAPQTLTPPLPQILCFVSTIVISTKDGPPQQPWVGCQSSGRPRPHVFTLPVPDEELRCDNKERLTHLCAVMSGTVSGAVCRILCSSCGAAREVCLPPECKHHH